MDHVKITILPCGCVQPISGLDTFADLNAILEIDPEMPESLTARVGKSGKTMFWVNDHAQLIGRDPNPVATELMVELGADPLGPIFGTVVAQHVPDEPGPDEISAWLDSRQRMSGL